MGHLNHWLHMHADQLDQSSQLAETVLPALAGDHLLRIGVPQEMGGVSERIRNPRYATAIGLLQAARGDAYGSPVNGAVAVKEPRESLLVKIKEWLKNNF